MKRSHRISYTLVAMLTLFSLGLAACAPGATAVPATLAAAATNVAPTVAAAATSIPATVAAVATSVAPAATDTAAPAPTTAPTVAPTTGPASAANTLVYDDNIDDIVSLDPAQAYEFSGILAVHNVYQGLVQYVGSDLSNLKPALADSWDIKNAGST